MPRPKGMSDNDFAELLINCPRSSYFGYSANSTKKQMKLDAVAEKNYKKKVQKDTREWNGKLGRIEKERVEKQKRMSRESITTVGIMIGSMNKI